MPDTDKSAAQGLLAKVRWGLWLVVGIVGSALVIFALGRSDGGPEPSSYSNAFGGPFELMAPDGSAVTEKTLEGKPFAIFFGFTRCPDVCPTSLSRMAQLRQHLGPDGMKFNIVFVSVDPGHDKPADLGRYVELFKTPIIGLTGTDAQLDRIKRAYRVFSAKVPKPGGDYTIDHTATIYLMTAKGEFSGTIDFHEPETTALEKLKRLIG